MSSKRNQFFLKIRAKWPEKLHWLSPLAGQAALLAGYKYRVPARDLVSGWFNGFYGDKHIYYDFKRFGYGSYLSDFARERKTQHINGAFAHLLNDKVLFSFLLRGLGSPTPRIFAEKAYGRLIRFYPTASVDQVVLKPKTGSGGKRVRFVLGRSLEDSITDGEIATEKVEQAGYGRDIFPDSTNTIRVLTVHEPPAEPFIACAVHRFGTSQSVPVDNWGAGGLSAYIDSTTGEIGAAVAKPDSSSLQWHEVHPETKTRIQGVRIPGWHQLATKLLELCERLTDLRYVGWDVVMTPDGFSILEGNNRTDVNLLQIHRPLLIDERLRRFYLHHKVI